MKKIAISLLIVLFAIFAFFYIQLNQLKNSIADHLTQYDIQAYNWDPVFQKKIRMDKNTWRGDPHYEMRHQRSYSNWAHNPMAGGVRKSLEEIRASGVRFRQLSERANGMMVNSVVMDSPIPLFGGSGVYINGGTIGGLDLMAVFTKNFWDKKGKERRERTLEVLRTYGDSTTVLINRPIEQIAR